MNFDITYPNLNFAHKTDVGPMFAENFEEHYHLIYEIIYLVDGDVDLVLENRVFHLNIGDLVFIQPGQHHHITPNPTTRYERYVLKFPEYSIPEEIRAKMALRPTQFSATNTVLPQLFAHLDWNYEHYSGSDLNLLFGSVLTEILVYYCAQPDDPEESVVFYSQKMADVVEYINVNLAEPLQIQDICEHFHYSKSHISKEFVKCMGVPIKQYIRTKKIFLAESLLNSGMKPTEVYRHCGFSDYSTFYRDYCKIIGKAPSSSKNAE